MNNLLPNPLATTTTQATGFRKPNRKAPVTVIAGIICQSAIVLASDSQTTFDGQSKRLDAEKIRVVTFRDGKAKALVAQSGATDTSSRIVDVMTRIARTRDLDSEEAPIKLAQEAMHTVREEIRHQHFDCKAEELLEIIQKEELDCALMVAHFFENRPSIHTFKFKTGITTTSRTYYEAIGIGGSLANYLLSELSTPEMDGRHGQAVAVYVIEKTIKHVAFCDGPVKLALIYPREPFYMPATLLDLFADELMPSTPPKPSPPDIFMDNVELVSQDEVDRIAAAVSRIDKETKDQRTEKLKSALFTYAAAEIPDYSGYTK